ncbi:MFS transporter [Anaerococcus marasmi]|uniref:MFS transporter n=1 Tax=Anaerococcus marasmi TaxID=2057797 RepID=UPI000CF9E0AD|nr:MFS transporter [Anaerococcus marasmi]
MNLPRSFIWKQRIGYGLADYACNLIWQMISLYLMFYYTDVVKMNGLQIASMFLVTRIIDGFTDLLIGYAIDNTNTRWGKSRPYFLWGAIPFAIFAYLTFSVPESMSVSGKVIYMYATYIGLSFMYTVVNIPMASILPSLTTDPQERTNLATVRQFFAFLGSTTVSYLGLKLVERLGNGNDAVGFKYVMLIFGIISSIIFFITFFTVREVGNPTKDKISLGDSVKSLKENEPWKIFALNIIFMWTALFIQSGSLVYYFTSVLGNKDLSVTAATLNTLLPVASNLMVPFLSKMTSKKKLFIYSSIVQLMGIVVVFLAGLNVMGSLIGVGISAIGFGVKVSIYFSMQADPVDYGIWKTGVDTSGSLSAINGFIGKIAQAIAGGLSGLLIAWGGYQGSSTVQTASAITSIKAMYLFIPIILTIGSIIVMMRYKLDDQLEAIRNDLEKREVSNEL